MAKTAYFIRRSSIFIKLRLSTGKATEWTPCLDGGVMKTTDATTIEELRKMSDEKRGGIREITEAEYEEFKKKPERKRAGQPVWQPMTTPPLPQAVPKKVSSASGAAVETKPAEADALPPVEKSQSKPETAKGILDP